MSRTDGRKGVQGLADPNACLADAAGRAARVSVPMTAARDEGRSAARRRRLAGPRGMIMIQPRPPGDDSPVPDRVQSTEPRPFTARGATAVLDSDLARLYGVPAAAVHQAIKRNLARFPEDFTFFLTAEEFRGLRSQIVTSKGRGGRRKLPRVFAEHGTLMVGMSLNSPHAVSTSVVSP